MGALFRSEKMSLCQLFIQPESAYYTIAELGEIGIAQFRDVSFNSSKISFEQKIFPKSHDAEFYVRVLYHCLVLYCVSYDKKVPSDNDN